MATAKKNKPSKQAKLVNEWRAAQSPSVTIQQLCDAVGDTGGQLFKWLGGGRSTIPLELKVRIAQHTGLPLTELADKDQLALARKIFAALAQDVATSGEAA